MPLFWRKNTNQFIVSTKTISCKLAAQNKRAVKAKSERVTLHSHLLWRCPMGLTRGTKYQTVKVSWSWGPMSSLLISQQVMEECGSVHYFGTMALANSFSCCCRKYTDWETNRESLLETSYNTCSNPNIKIQLFQIQIQRATRSKWRACYLSQSLFKFNDLISRIIQLVVLYEIRSTIQIATIVKDKM